MDLLSNHKWQVFVQCFTFNQARYIEDAMDGFSIQKTNFPYLCMVMDDASTDGEQEVIKKYLKENFVLCNNNQIQDEETDNYVLTIAQHKRNPNCFFAVFYLKYNHYGKKSKLPYFNDYQDNSKYIAICEGDDYWIDKYKLQRQVDFLEKHKEYMMHFHNAIVRYQNHDKADYFISQFQTGDFSTSKLFEKWQLPLASVLFRVEVYKSSILKELQKVAKGGFTFFIAASRMGKVYGLSESLSIYRRNDGGVSNSMTTAYCMFLNYGFAIASGDKSAVCVMKKRALMAMIDYFPSWLIRKKDAIELKKAIDVYDKMIFYKAFFLQPLYFPIKFIRKIIELCGVKKS